jgi:hypothetical protein
MYLHQRTGDTTVAQSLKTPLMQRHNDPISIFKNEDSRKGKPVATKTKKATTTETTAQHNGHHPEQLAKQVPPSEQSPKQAPGPVTLTQQHQREALKAAGLKRCPQHARLLDVLPDEAKVVIDGQTDVSIRPLSEYQKSTSVCRACDHIIQRAWRLTHKPAGSTPNIEKQQATLDKLIAQRDALQARIDLLTTTIASEKNA